MQCNAHGMQYDICKARQCKTIIFILWGGQLHPLTLHSTRYNQRHREVSAKLSLLHLESLSEAKINLWMPGKAEVELVDMVLRIRSKLEEAKKDELPLPDIVIERLEGHIATIVATLPPDLQGVIASGGGGGG